MEKSCTTCTLNPMCCSNCEVYLDRIYEDGEQFNED